MKQRVFDHIRQHLHELAGIEKSCAGQRMLALYHSEWSAGFERLQRDRLVMGALRYGPIHNGMKTAYDRVRGIQKRLTQYAETGNTECLVDIANLALLEFEEGQHPKRHFKQIHEDHCCV